MSESIVTRILEIEKSAGMVLGTYWTTGLKAEEWVTMVTAGRARMESARKAKTLAMLAALTLTEPESQPMRAR